MLTKAIDLANAAGKSRAYISQETKRGHLIRDLNGKYDTENPVNKNWIISKGIKSSDIGSGKKIVRSKAVKKQQPKPKPKVSQKKTPVKKAAGKNTSAKSKKKKDAEETPEESKQIEALKSKDTSHLSPVEFEELMGIPGKLKDMTLEQVVFGYGNIPGLKSYAETLDKIMSGLKKSVEIQEKKRELITRDFFKGHVVSYLEILSEQLFDYAGTDKKKLKDFSKMIKHTQRSIDNELKKLHKLQEAASGD